VRVTPLAWALLLLLAVSVGVAVFGASSLQGPAFAVAVFVLFVMVIGAFPRGLSAWRGSSSPREPPAEPAAEVLDTVENPEAWSRERQRRERDGR
jgi:uncharacterized membrane protein YccC